MGKSPLQCACASPYMDPRQNKEMVVFILKAGANPNIIQIRVATQQWTLQSGLESKGSRELVRLLLEADFNLGKMDQWGEDYLTLGNQN